MGKRHRQWKKGSIDGLSYLKNIVGWSRKYNLKMLIDKAAFQTYRLLPDTVKASYRETVDALRKRFKPVDIEELRGIEFHKLTQGTLSVEKLGLELQRLAKRAFPSLSGKDVDRLLKGRFFQALQTRWQRKLGALKPEETFDELFSRARVAECREHQYVEVEGAVGKQNKTVNGANEKREQTTDSNKSKRVKDSEKPAEEQSKSVEKPNPSSARRSYRNLQCNACYRFGHIARYCRNRSRGSAESPGKSAPKALVTTAELTDEQLEEEISKRKLAKERTMLESTSSVQMVSGQAIGPTMLMNVEVEGVLVSAVVDTGSQSTIISRPFLHKVKRHLDSQGKSMPELELPVNKFYGKSGASLEITARVDLTISADGQTAKVPVFIQPCSEQNCLLGSNVLSLLGVTVQRANGEVIGTSTRQAEAVTVRLVQAVRLPRKTSIFAEAKVEGCCREGDTA